MFYFITDKFIKTLYFLHKLYARENNNRTLKKKNIIIKKYYYAKHDDTS